MRCQLVQATVLSNCGREIELRLGARANDTECAAQRMLSKSWAMVVAESEAGRSRRWMLSPHPRGLYVFRSGALPPDTTPRGLLCPAPYGNTFLVFSSPSPKGTGDVAQTVLRLGIANPWHPLWSALYTFQCQGSRQSSNAQWSPDLRTAQACAVRAIRPRYCYGNDVTQGHWEPE
ncbi:hypothetical protein BC628DRAFT_1051717 [Trametes gibbosa]|nr:hypothetical protein BC628DRAFT_1051717 [Trametes gibbosa]